MSLLLKLIGEVERESGRDGSSESGELDRYMRVKGVAHSLFEGIPCDAMGRS